MSIGGLLLGIVNVAIVVALFLLLGAIVVMIAKWFGWPIDWDVQRIYLLVVMLIALYLIIALFLGLPTWRVVTHASYLVPMIV